ncbi:Glycosyltransferase involved in cell wall bisynthesis [Lachnospiraceae bacterium KH1T2]|nr:Glycosyltransferase involved in cell wall bisynthesis [Lachnospiraceae bacterium KH1T2]
MDSRVFSIIVPFYKTNYGQFCNCINSVRNQSFNDFECIVVDDGNPPEYAKYLEVVPSDDERFRIVHEENKGLSAARNLGIKNSIGDWILFLDSDDYLTEDCLKTVHDKIGNADLAIFGFVGDREERGLCFPNQLLKVEDFLGKPSRFNDYAYINSACNKAFNASFLRSYNIEFNENYNSVEDADFCAKYFARIDRVRMIEEELYVYVNTENSMSKAFYPNYCEIEIANVEKIYANFKKHVTDVAERHYLAFWLYAMFLLVAEHYMKAKEGRKSLRSVLKRLRKNPLFKEIYIDFENNEFFKGKRERVKAGILWRYFGAEGMYLSLLIASFMSLIPIDFKDKLFPRKR